MYQPLTPGYRKSDAAMRWALPDRVFFACGACHILAYAFLARWGQPGMQAIWIKPKAGYVGNHVFVDGRDWVFDYHGYAPKDRFIEHVWRGACRRWSGWDATLVPLPRDVLISERKSRTYDGLWLREPRQFLHDAMPRAEAYLQRFQRCRMGFSPPQPHRSLSADDADKRR
jgi:hypothetical protein